jgi:hypothetical protein
VSVNETCGAVKVFGIVATVPVAHTVALKRDMNWYVAVGVWEAV